MGLLPLILENLMEKKMEMKWKLGVWIQGFRGLRVEGVGFGVQGSLDLRF